MDPLTAAALTYVTNLILSNEEVKKFPEDFVTASIRWIRSWFLEDDPVTKTVVESDIPTVAKEAVLKAKLEQLLKNPEFVQQLSSQLVMYNDQRERIKNVANNVKIEVEGNAHIGDKGTGDTGEYDEKNVVKGGSVKVGKDFRLGDDSTN